MAIKLSNRFSELENEYSISEKEFYDNQHSYEYPTRLSNKRRPRVVINQYSESDRLLQKDQENVQRTV